MTQPPTTRPRARSSPPDPATPARCRSTVPSRSSRPCRDPAGGRRPAAGGVDRPVRAGRRAPRALRRAARGRELRVQRLVDAGGSLRAWTCARTTRTPDRTPDATLAARTGGYHRGHRRRQWPATRGGRGPDASGVTGVPSVPPHELSGPADLKAHERAAAPRPVRRAAPDDHRDRRPHGRPPGQLAGRGGADGRAPPAAGQPDATSIVWDTGHQAYAHKLLTGRLDRFGTLRQLGGIGGFPRRVGERRTT